MTSPLPPVGDVTQVLHFPPSPLINREDWTQKDSDILAHFLQVNGRLCNCSWKKSPCKITVQGDQAISSQLPSAEAFVFAAVYFRQLYEGDRLFSDACAVYADHSGDAFKVKWVKEQLAAFHSALNAEPGSISLCPSFNCSLGELIEAFFYGALLLHGPRKASAKSRQRFQAMIKVRSREEILYSLNFGMRCLCAYPLGVAMVVQRDMAQWQQNGWIPDPDVWWHSTLFGPLEAVPPGSL